MKKFELWLDESGDFDNDSQKVMEGKNPSLIGGLLIAENSFTNPYITAIIPEDTYHAKDANDSAERFKKIAEKLYKNKENRLVVFNNQECIMILDDNLTYLNIMTEGIIQLIKHLKGQYGEIFLRIIIAIRPIDCKNKKSKLVPTVEYEKRLKEKLLMAGLENDISNHEWELQTADARKDKRLQLADIVCNTYLTRRAKKFNKAERAYIKALYDDDKTLKFHVFEPVLEKNFKSHLLENRIGEAVSGICLSANKNTLETCFSLLKLNFSAHGVHNILFQYKFIEACMEYYIHVVRDFALCTNFLQNLLDYYIPLLTEYEETISGNLVEKLTLDIKLNMLEVCTHRGDIGAADRLVIECEKAIEKLPVSLDAINNRINFETRKIVNLTNAFDFEAALERADAQVKRCRNIKDLLDLAESDTPLPGFASGNTAQYYDELAQALGTRLQIKTFMLREKLEMYDSALSDSEEAIKEFENEDDKKRQYSYRVQLETDHGDYEAALKYLKLSVAADENCSERELWNLSENQESLFAVSAYIRLMAESAADSKWDKADRMYQAVSTSGYLQSRKFQESMSHPKEIILWKYGYYSSFQKGQENAVLRYYNEASDLCFASETSLTLNVIGMGIEFETMGVLLALHRPNGEIVNHGGQMKQRWDGIMSRGGKDILERLFGKEVDFQNKDSEYYMKLGRKITY